MVKAFHNSYRIINMDRYYGSCISVMNLRRHGLYSRCTTMESKSRFPASISFHKSDMHKFGRGSYRFCSESEYGMVAFSWCDGKPVNILTTADGSRLGSVQRQIGSKKFNIQSPVAVQKYNKNMHGVDRWDQLLGKFALHRRHKFKKYYRNIMMVIIDFAILQSQIHYHLAHPYLTKLNNYRVKFYETLAHELIITDWKKELMRHLNASCEGQDISDILLGRLGIPINGFVDVESKGVQNYVFNQSCKECSPLSTNTIIPRRYLLSKENPPGNCDTCNINGRQGCIEHRTVPFAKSVDGKCCQICKFEGRGRKTKSVNFCMKHKVRCCTISYGDNTKSGVFYETRQKYFPELH